MCQHFFDPEHVQSELKSNEIVLKSVGHMCNKRQCDKWNRTYLKKFCSNRPLLNSQNFVKKNKNVAKF